MADQDLPRWMYFRIMGNNCRIQGLPHIQAEKVADSKGSRIEDFNNFWFGYHRGDQAEFVSLPKEIP